MARLLTIGEALGVAWTSVGDPLRTAGMLQLSTAGAEATVAIGMRRLGHEATWVGTIGADPLGERVRRDLAAEGVDVRFVRTVASAPTAFMLRDRVTAEHVRVSYYRDGSAGTQLSAADVDAAFASVPDFDVVHLTGITPALSDSCHDAVRRAISTARARNALVSFDVNLRTTLAGSRYVASRARETIADVDIVFVGDDELCVLTERTDHAAAARELLAAGPREIVIKHGAAGATSYLADGRVCTEPALRVSVADVIGAGDSFVAGYLSALCDGCPPDERVTRGNLCAACTVGTHGDWQGLPTSAELAVRSARSTTIR